MVSYMFNYNNIKLRNRRSVAPVIATLLMVAIAVVGGMLVFVFAQDFFTQTESMTGPTIEQIQVYGYDFRDVSSGKIVNHNGATCTAVVGNSGGDLRTSDVVALYIRNNGNLPVFIGSVKLFGAGPEQVTTGVISALIPLTNKWVIVDTALAEDAVCGPAVELPVDPGARATILIGWADTFVESGDAIKVGRPVFVSVTTEAGNVFTKTVINGRSVG